MHFHWTQVYQTLGMWPSQAWPELGTAQQLVFYIADRVVGFIFKHFIWHSPSFFTMVSLTMKSSLLLSNTLLGLPFLLYYGFLDDVHSNKGSFDFKLESLLIYKWFLVCFWLFIVIGCQNNINSIFSIADKVLRVVYKYFFGHNYSSYTMVSCDKCGKTK